jgi:hypothetical protein
MNLSVLVLWVAFFVGQMVYILMRASWAIRSKTNPVKSRWDFFYMWWDVILVRTLIEVALFWMYKSYPDVLTSLAAKAGLTWNLSLPLVPPVAFFVGLTADFMLDWVLAHFSFFQKDEIPHLPPTNSNGDASKGQGAGN